MNIHEFQAKGILKKYGVTIQEGMVASSAAEAVEAAAALKSQTGTQWWVIKAQIHAGGRGKGGGVKLAKSMDEVRKIAGDMIGMTLVTPQTGSQGKVVHKVLVAQDVYYPGPSERAEYYLSILLDRKTGRNVIVYSPEGGVEIEVVAAERPEKIFRETIEPGMGILPFQGKRIAYNLGLTGVVAKRMVAFVEKLYNAYIAIDASLFEINPVLKTTDDLILAVDAKVNLDDSALFRHPEIEAMRDLAEEDPAEVEAAANNLNFVKLDGNVGCMVNGAGLAMATMDVIKLSGGHPANFLDVGGGANAETVEAGLKIILADPNVKAVLINIFGGIVRCDRVANGVVEAYKKLGDITVPVIVRLQGTNAQEGKDVIDGSGLKVYSAVTLKEAADLVKELV
ncbi:ADP-forming succinate--CoA ligase subunit beta [Geofilum sp. OHC36d9]|uniref:ADP-forming succinate--CoA ligase subunit beta n=1 Tax=Geofilum sp. OHC36d9 TaxID=3458413 RepID=UPI004034A9C7